MLAAHNHAVEKDRKHHHYLKGSLYCGRCGSRMSLIHAKGNGGTYPYFFCIARMKGTGCEQPYVPVELVERAVESAYAQVRLPAKRAQLVRVTLDKALDLLANCERSYRKAPGHLRRQWNQARSSSGSSSTTTASIRLRSPSPSPPSPTPSCPSSSAAVPQT